MITTAQQALEALDKLEGRVLSVQEHDTTVMHLRRYLMDLREQGGRCACCHCGCEHLS